MMPIVTDPAMPSRYTVVNCHVMGVGEWTGAENAQYENMSRRATCYIRATECMNAATYKPLSKSCSALEPLTT